MRRALLAGLAVLFAATAVPAHAHPGYHYRGGCGYLAVRDDSTSPPTWTGEVEADAVATDHAGVPVAVPISIDCVVYINGHETTVLSANGPGVAAGARTWSYRATDDDWVTMCEVVTIGTEPPDWSCGPDPEPWFPPEPVRELMDLAIDTVTDTIAETFPEDEACDAFADAAPGVPGVVDVTPEGDVYVTGTFFWDCPPYWAGRR